VALDYVKRSEAEQAAMVASGASETMHSKHLDGLAADLLLYEDGAYVTSAEPYASLGAYWKTLDPANVWGGDWETLVDAGHFEYAG
jgi:peptidoglycan L-alanyl-D-glutamate endopeptidase CwlK